MSETSDSASKSSAKSQMTEQLIQMASPCDSVVRGALSDALHTTLLLKVNEGLCCCWILRYQVVVVVVL